MHKSKQARILLALVQDLIIFFLVSHRKRFCGLYLSKVRCFLVSFLPIKQIL